eukprot:CAMPEP_0182896910 /NCGR_PEP_ID=MMETSP0034_2-20130328/26566_1 /TAXON_ID=156128 /ORGANISM="Nephroselmis pyriformis, Strain CCMP717" /LENGTH=146 /DNA_ID=CAMNT_0025030795 /DNA_START=90 /DNA_END=530 /DNA_ORIENTATION=+
MSDAKPNVNVGGEEVPEWVSQAIVVTMLLWMLSKLFGVVSDFKKQGLAINAGAGGSMRKKAKDSDDENSDSGEDRGMFSDGEDRGMFSDDDRGMFSDGDAGGMFSDYGAGGEGRRRRYGAGPSEDEGNSDWDAIDGDEVRRSMATH